MAWVAQVACMDRCRVPRVTNQCLPPSTPSAPTHSHICTQPHPPPRLSPPQQMMAELLDNYDVVLEDERLVWGASPWIHMRHRMPVRLIPRRKEA